MNRNVIHLLNTFYLFYYKDNFMIQFTWNILCKILRAWIQKKKFQVFFILLKNCNVYTAYFEYLCAYRTIFYHAYLHYTYNVLMPQCLTPHTILHANFQVVMSNISQTLRFVPPSYKFQNHKKIYTRYLLLSCSLTCEFQYYIHGIIN